MRRLMAAIGWVIAIVVTAVVGYLLAFFVIPYLVAPDSLDRKEAQELLNAELAPYRAKQYRELVGLVGETITREVIGNSGKTYTIDVQGFWDDKPNQDVRVMAAISDSGKSAFVPMTDGFIMAQSGKFIGE